MANFRPYRTEAGHRRVLVVVRIKGFKPVRKAFASKRDAEEWAAQTENELRELRDRGGARPDLGTLTVRQVAESFLADPKTRQRTYHPELTTLLAPWCDEYGTVRARAFGRLQVVARRDKLLADGLSPARVNRYLSAMRRAWNWGRECGYVTGGWPQKVMLEEPKPEAVLERYGVAAATIEDITAVIASCDARSAPLGNLVRFMIGTGARVSDALAVRWRDVDLGNKTVGLRGQKTKHPLRVAMLTPAVEGVRRQAAVKHVGGRVFWQFADRFDSGREFGAARPSFPMELRRMRAHDCRHLCASFLAAHGASHVELAAQLGHTTLAMVKRYAHLHGGHRGAAHDKLDEAFGGGGAGRKP